MDRTWYSAASTGSLKKTSFTGSSRRTWRPLGDTWREWEANGTSPMRSNCDEASAFAYGTVPHWHKGNNIRKKGTLEHELTWAYYRTQRHPEHPLRKEVGERLPNPDVVMPMRSGKENSFNFWRDLRPPFFVMEVQRIDPQGVRHPDGDLFEVTYECAIDYRSERLWGGKSDGGTFNNRIHGVAKIRIPDNYPTQRPLVILNWGKPTLNYEPPDEPDGEKRPISPSTWMPIADELQMRANHPRLAECREATRRCKTRKEVHMPPMQRMLLGPHPLLPHLERVEHNRAKAEHSKDGVGSKPIKKRTHRVCTSAAGFVTFHG